VFERFTDRARRAVVLAQEEARMLNHTYIGTEHLLLGLIHERDGIGAQTLESLNISLENVRDRVTEIVGRGETAPTGHIPFTPRAKKVLELSLREALQLGHKYIGTEHLLLGLIREGEGVAAQVLLALDADFARVREMVVQLLTGAVELRAAAGHEAVVAELQMSEAGFVSAEGVVGPQCPGCRADLADTAAGRMLRVPSEEEGVEDVTVRVIYCRSCGHVFATESP
jgi:ATP-dependent Clp protease ATP-binding subunit ClpC